MARFRGIFWLQLELEFPRDHEVDEELFEDLRCEQSLDALVEVLQDFKLDFRRRKRVEPLLFFGAALHEFVAESDEKFERDGAVFEDLLEDCRPPVQFLSQVEEAVLYRSPEETRCDEFGVGQGVQRDAFDQAKDRARDVEDEADRVRVGPVLERFQL